MTKKDYIKLAAALRTARSTTSARADENIRFGIAQVERHIVQALLEDNPRFNVDKFREASGHNDETLRSA
jgi:hypothetical protein